MNIILCDMNSLITREWRQAFDGLNNVIVYTGRFESLPEVFPEAKFVMCTAGNSFGVMGGGLDLAVAKYFYSVEEYVRRTIETEFFGEIPVGAAFCVNTEPGETKFRYVMYVPTMRAPIRLYSTGNVYLATRAALRTFTMLDDEDLVLVMPGFGGQCGQLNPKAIASAMRLAYDNHLFCKMPRNTTEMMYIHREIGSTNE